MNNYAVNVLDLTDKIFDAGPLSIAGLLVGPVTPNKVVVDVEKKRLDGSGVVLECEDDRAEAIIATLNLKTLVRGYKKGSRGGWKRLTKAEVESFK